MTEQHTVYFLLCIADHRVKIGTAKSSLRRANQHRRANFTELKFLGQIDGGFATERRIHKLLSAYLVPGRTEVFFYVEPVRQFIDICLTRSLAAAAENLSHYCSSRSPAMLCRTGRGRPSFVATVEMRAEVQVLHAHGMPVPNIARKIGVSLPTLRKHFATELDLDREQNHTSTEERLAISTYKENFVALERISGLKPHRAGEARRVPSGFVELHSHLLDRCRREIEALD